MSVEQKRKPNRPLVRFRLHLPAPDPLVLQPRLAHAPSLGIINRLSYPCPETDQFIGPLSLILSPLSLHCVKTRSSMVRTVTEASQTLTRPALIVRSGSHRCALPLEHVVETMRPLPIQSLVNMPPFVCGAAIIRGEPVPVVHLDRLLNSGVSAAGRFVVVRVEERTVVLAVEGVVEVKDLSKIPLQSVPPLLDAAEPGLVGALGSCDERLLVVLEAARLLSDEVWEALTREDEPAGQGTS